MQGIFLTRVPSYSRALTVLAAALISALLGCDGYIAVEGRVYARPEVDTLLPSEGTVDGLAPATEGLAPLAGAVVYVFHDPKDTVSHRPDTLLWVDSDTSTADGLFRTGSTTCPCRFTALLRVRRAGYRGIDIPFSHDSMFHRAFVVLTPVPHGLTTQ